MKNCEQVQELLLALLDGEASAEQRAEIEAHLATCEACRREKDELDQTRRVIGGVIASRAVGADFAKATADKAAPPPKRGMSPWEWNARVSVLKWVAVAVIVLGFAAIIPSKFTPIPGSGGNTARLETRVFTQQSFLAGSRTSVRVLARDWKDETPIREAEVELKLVSIHRADLQLHSPQDIEVVLAKGTTDRDGTLSVDFVLPDLPEGAYAIDVRTKAGETSTKLWYPVQLRRATAIYLTTDKPLYQPGQVIHVRSLAVKKSDLKPIGVSKITLEIEDPKGNKILKALGETSKFGIAETTLRLGDEINLGLYTVRAIVENGGKTETTEKKITVDRYSLPKFKIVAKADKEYYHPKETVKLHIQADYFFGKPVADAEIEVVGTTLEAGPHEFFRGTARTDATGACDFPDVLLPEYFVGQPLLQGKGIAQFEVRLTDPGKQIESTRVVTTVSEGDLQVVAFPDGGELMPGLSNIVWVAANYPDGAPAKAHVVVTLPDGLKREVDTDELGLGTFEFEAPKGIAVFKAQLEAKDAAGQAGRAEVDLAERAGDHGLRVVLDRATYRVGERLKIGVMSTTKTGDVYVDIVRNGQTALTRSLDLVNGRGQIEVELPNDLFGVIEVSAYEVKKSLNIVRDSRKAFVSPAEDLRIAIALDKETYRPGETATLDLQVTDADGRPVFAALGVWVVDPAVLARAEIAPGLEKVFFLLEKELLKPRYEIHGLSPDEVLIDTSYKQRDRAAKALFAASETIERHPVRLSSRDEQIKDEVKQDAEALAKAAKAYVGKERERLHEKEIVEDWKRVLGAVQKASDEGKLHPELKTMAEAYDRLWAAIQKYWTLGKPQLDGTLEGLLREKLITEAELTDPWGSRYTCNTAFCSCGADKYPHELQLVTSGRDKQAGTGDEWVMATNHALQQGAPSTTVEELVKLGYLKPEDAKDPWGTSYIGTIYAPGNVQGYWSGGPDGKPATPDDLYLAGENIAGAFLTQAPVERFAELGLCLPAATLDPFGEKYTQVQAYGSWETGIILASNGADGQAGTPDDLYSSAVTEQTGAYKLATVTRADLWQQQAGQGGWGWEERGVFMGGLDAENRVVGGDLLQWRAMNGEFDVRLGLLQDARRELGEGERDRMMVFALRAGDATVVDGLDAFNANGALDFNNFTATSGYTASIELPRASGLTVGGVVTQPSAPAARLREFFPETLFVAPEVVTDAQGRARLTVPLADTITRWEASAFANSLDGRMGSTTKAIPVFQDFFLDVGLPPYLTQNDTVTIPVSVMNYSKTRQDVTVKLKPETWYELEGGYEAVVRVEPEKVEGVTFTLRAKSVGRHALRIDATSASLADAMQRRIEVIPDGREVTWSASDRLEGKKAHRFEVPDGCVEGASGLLVRVYPGVFAQVVDGMDSMLCLPGG